MIGTKEHGNQASVEGEEIACAETSKLEECRRCRIRGHSKSDFASKIPTHKPSVVYYVLSHGSEVLGDMPVIENYRNYKCEEVKRGTSSFTGRIERSQDREGKV